MDNPPPEQKRSFRRMLMDIEHGMTQQNLHELAFCYEKDVSEDNHINGLTLFRDLLREGAVYCNDVALIDELIESLKKIKCADLAYLVKDYKTKWDLNFRVPCRARPNILRKEWGISKGPSERELESTVSSSEEGQLDECQKAMNNVMISGSKEYQPYRTARRGMKRRKVDSGTLDERELSHNNGEFSDDDEPPKPHSEDDKKFMKMALDVAKQSPDKQVQVGAVLINPRTKNVLGTGFNRMPQGCEEFPWLDDEDADNPLETKYPFVFHGAKAAIKDAHENKKDIRGSVLYTTLFPANTDAQWIVDCGIKEMVYLDNMYKDRPFSKAAKMIFNTIQYRRMEKCFESTSNE